MSLQSAPKHDVRFFLHSVYDTVSVVVCVCVCFEWEAGVYFMLQCLFEHFLVYDNTSGV